MSSVINIKKANLIKLNYRDLEHWLEDPNHIYVGRNMSFYVKGATASKWQNTFSAKKYGRDKCVEMYRDNLLKNQELMNSLHELKGKTLGCWCKPERCHGDVLVELVSNLDN
jgi:hypothetical protein